MSFRVSFFFSLTQGLKVGGWSINLYNNLTDLSAVRTATDSMQARLNTLTGNTVSCYAARIQDLLNFRAAVLVPYGFTPPIGSSANANTDTFNTAALVKITDGARKVTRFWVRGLVDDAVTNNGSWLPTGAYKRQWNLFFAELTTAGKGWSQRKLDTSAPKTFVQQITPAGVVTSVGHGLIAGNLVRIGRVQNPKTLNKIFRVAAKIDNDNFSIVGPPPMTGNAIVGASTYAQKQGYSFIGITTAEVERVSSHKTGRPFGLLSGRRRPVKT